ncbi:MAG: hypothetical protein ACC644_00905 [Candidatus Hydrothermarchaeales archaeon]
MVHVPYIAPFLKFELLVSTAVVVYLLFTAITKKDMILSETAFSRFKNSWPKFKSLFYIGFIGLSFFIIIVAFEFMWQIGGSGFRADYHVEFEIAKVGLLTTVIAFGLLNIHIVRILLGGGE